MSLGFRLGVEVELLAPRGSNRRVLASSLAALAEGSVERFLHPDAEPSKVEGTELFHNLTHGFRVRSPNGEVVAWLVDDITLQDDLKRAAPPKPRLVAHRQR